MGRRLQPPSGVESAQARGRSASPIAAPACAAGGRLPRLVPARAGRRRRRSARPSPACASAAARPSPRGSRPSARPSRTPRTSAPEGRTAGQLLEAAGCRGLRVGGARFSEKHANFVENEGEATTADVLELMAEGRRRVHERFGVVLEPEVQTLGEVRWPRGLGAVRRRLAVAALGALVVVASPSTSCSSATPSVDPAPDLGARRPRRSAKARRPSGCRPNGIVLSEHRLRKTARCRGCRSSAPPKDGRLAGHCSNRRTSSGAAPAALRPCLAGSHYGESGVDVKLRSGIELRFGDTTPSAGRSGQRRRRCSPTRR